MKLYEANGYGKYQEGCGTLRASGGDNGPGSEMLCVGLSRNRTGGVCPTMTGDHNNRVTDYSAVATYPQITGSLCANSHPGSYTGQDAFNNMLPVVPSDESYRKYIIRRLTPLECCRLQGFPDWWIEGCEQYPVDSTWANSEAMKYINPYGKINGSDSAQYRLWGNGMALPNMLFVMRRIAEANHDQA